MRVFGFLAMALLAPMVAQASENGDLLTSHLYAGTLAEGQAAFAAGKDAGDPDACFGWGLLSLAGAVEGLAQDLYRYGATTPGTALAARILGGGMMDAPAPANPAPEQLSYAGLRTVLSDFRSEVAAAQAGFLCGGEAGSDYAMSVDVLQARLDFNGDGKAEEGETLGAFLAPLLGELAGADLTPDDKALSKGVVAAPDSVVGFDAADAIWFAGYSQILMVHLDLVLAHDFEAFFDAYLHRVFPKAGLPMQDYAQGGTLMLDPDSDAGIADIIAAIHTLNFPVIDRPLLASIPAALKQVTALSRQNWDLILAETDDNAELIPNPGQTARFEGMAVTDDTVAAWRETLDVLDQIIAGDLLIPHWRFSQGFDLKAYFETSERSDLVMLLTGQGALPYLRDGPIADAQSFAAGNAVFGEEFFLFALWFN
ncbi:hypothetical protein [Devosia beringensis]|uniref:hypothetical protein n=1 Tax=Devosia beringensis TaxID=2657486 RepID=UPI00186B6E87|nr:hypothetical protein [Devosia beringensis]